MMNYTAMTIPMELNRIFRIQCIAQIILLYLLQAGWSILVSQTFTKITIGSPATELGAWRSVNWIDYDHDADLDLFVTRGKSGGQDNVLFRNDGPPFFTFTRMSSLILSQDHEPSDGSSWADVQNDGNLDCFVANWYARSNLLYQNNGNGDFSRILSGPVVTGGGYSETGSWGDYNNDGLIDLYVANSAGSRVNFLYKNTGNGQFMKVTTGFPVTDAHTSRGVNWVDYDNDGDLDLFVANESSQNEDLYKNMLSETGIDTFARVVSDPLVTAGGSSWSGSWGDFDNDGDQDVFVANFENQTSSLFINNGDGSFSKSLQPPIATDSGYGASGSWADMDNDGDLDLIVTHAYSGAPDSVFFYKNLLMETDSVNFQRITTGPIIADRGYMYGASWGDFDNDGDLDLFIARTLSENQTNAWYRNNGNANHWLTLECRGTQTNSAAIGTKLFAKSIIGGKPVRQLRVIEGQTGYCGQNLQPHFGFGDAAMIDSLVIDWPSGNQEVFVNIPADRQLLIVENDSTPLVPIAPSNGFVNQSPNIQLRWKRSLYYPPYRLQVAIDSTFIGGMILDTVITPDTVAVLEVQHTLMRYYWRVKPERSIHTGTWSSVQYFDNDIVPPVAPLLLEPSDAASNVSLSPKLTWGRSQNATSYHVHLAADSAFSQGVVDAQTADTSFTCAGLGYLTQYFWKIEGENIAGTGTPSSPRTFVTIIQQPEVPVLSAPLHETVDVVPPATLSWYAADRAAQYHLQISADSGFTSLLVDDSSVMELYKDVPLLGSLQNYYWRVRASNVGGQSLFSPVWMFRSIVSKPIPVEPSDESTLPTYVTFRWTMSPSAESYRLQLSEDSLFSALIVNDSMLVDTMTVASDLAPQHAYFWRVRSEHPQSTSGWSDVRHFMTTLETFSFDANTLWNLFSVPANVANRSKENLFPGSFNQVFSYDGGYVAVETLDYGRGYWLRVEPTQQLTFQGTRRFIDTVSIDSGWNLIGTISQNLAVADIVSIPPSVSISGFFGYSGRYHIADTLYPSFGYWVKTDQPAQLILAGGLDPGAVSRSRIRIEPTSEHPPQIPPFPANHRPQNIPDEFELHQNYPNPFNPTTVIRYQLPVESHVKVTIYDMLGREVGVPVDEFQSAGFKSARWDAGALPSGIYLCKLTAGSFTQDKKMVLTK